MNVRIAVPTDEDAIFFLLLDMAAENSTHPVCAQKSLDTIRQVIAAGGAAVVLDDDNEIVGSVGIGPRQAWFSNYTFLGDYWLFVRKDRRNSRAALLLKKIAQDVAKGVKLDLVFAVFSTTDAERKSRFFARDMTYLGGSYVMEVEK